MVLGLKMMIHVVFLIAVLLLAGCSGGGVSKVTPPTVTIANPMHYLAQSREIGGQELLQAGDPWLYERFDFGRYQLSQSFQVDATHATTIWSYPPFGPFIAAHGDGGETYEMVDGTVYITSTQDGSKPGIQQFGRSWWAFDNRIPNCPAWRYGPIGASRACRTDVTYPTAAGATITADTIISEHGTERSYFGGGRLAWQVWGPQGSCTPPIDLAARAPRLSFDGPPEGHPDWILCDVRIVTNTEPADGSMSGIRFGWPPG